MRIHTRKRQKLTLEAVLQWVNTRLGVLIAPTPTQVNPELIAYVPLPPIKHRASRVASPKVRPDKEATKELRAYKQNLRRERRLATVRTLTSPTSLLITLNVAVLLVVSIALLGPFRNTPVNSETSQVERSAASALEIPMQRFLPSVSQSDLSGEPKSTSVPRHVWVTPWNAESLTTVSGRFSSTSAFWLTVNEDGATLSTKGDWSVWDRFSATLPSTTERYVTVSGDPDYTYLILASPETQTRFIANLVATAQEHSFTGVDINFEMLGEENRELFTAFIRNLGAVTRSNSLSLAVTVESRIANAVPMDWRTIGSIANEVRVMVYDYHSKNTNEPGPIAPLGWVQDVVSYAVTQVPATKLVIGLGNYGYQWRAPLEPGGLWQGVGVSYDKALTIATENNATVFAQNGIDSRGYEIGGTPSFSYTDTEGRLRSVWFENEESLSKKLAILSSFAVKGVIFWSVGMGDPLVWIDPSSPREISPQITTIPTLSPTQQPMAQ